MCSIALPMVNFLMLMMLLLMGTLNYNMMIMALRSFVAVMPVYLRIAIRCAGTAVR